MLDCGGRGVSGHSRGRRSEPCAYAPACSRSMISIMRDAAVARVPRAGICRHPYNCLRRRLTTSRTADRQDSSPTT
jgi:hypothetical protein